MLRSKTQALIHEAKPNTSLKFEAAEEAGDATSAGSDSNSPVELAWPPTPVVTESCGPAVWWPAEAWN